MFAEHGAGGAGHLWAAEVRRAATGSLVDAFEPRVRGAVSSQFPAGARRRRSRSGSAGRSDSLIEFVKTNAAILPLLILTATTTSDELSYGLNDVRATDARVR